jgi:hypothetical protein
MGTLSTRGLHEFGMGQDIRDRIDGLSENVGRRIDDIAMKVEEDSKHEGAWTKKLEKQRLRCHP